VRDCLRIRRRHERCTELVRYPEHVTSSPDLDDFACADAVGAECEEADRPAPVGGMPRSAPWCVPRAVMRIVVVSPSHKSWSMVHCASGNAVVSALGTCRYSSAVSSRPLTVRVGATNSATASGSRLFPPPAKILQPGCGACGRLA